MLDTFGLDALDRQEEQSLVDFHGKEMGAVSRQDQSGGCANCEKLWTQG